MRYLLTFFTCLLALTACDKPQTPKVPFANTDVTGLDYAKGFTLTDHTGKRRTLADFKGKVVVVFFGYTHCPDVCPTTLAEMAGIMKALGAEAARLQVLFITLDPERDTPELMANTLPGLFIAGEMLDWEAPTGGYLLSACLASGRLAGLGAAKYLLGKAQLRAL